MDTTITHAPAADACDDDPQALTALCHAWEDSCIAAQRTPLSEQWAFEVLSDGACYAVLYARAKDGPADYPPVLATEPCPSLSAAITRATAGNRHLARTAR